MYEENVTLVVIFLCYVVHMLSALKLLLILYIYITICNKTPFNRPQHPVYLVIITNWLGTVEIVTFATHPTPTF